MKCWQNVNSFTTDQYSPSYFLVYRTQYERSSFVRVSIQWKNARKKKTGIKINSLVNFISTLLLNNGVC